MKNILITGGSGLVGTHLTEILLEKGYQVSHLSRRKAEKKGITVYQWNVNDGFIEEEAIAKADCIVHLAGAGVADSRWTDARKKVIIDSRVKSSALLHQYLSKKKNKVTSFIGASAIGFYGDRGNELLAETASKGNDFLSKTTQLWEESSDKIESLNIRRVLLRIGIVLSLKGGALPKTAFPLHFCIGSYFGNGQQFYSWIHIDDLCKMFVFAIENEHLKGIFNAVAPNPVTNKTFVRNIGEAMNKKNILLPTPSFAMRLLLGEMSSIVLNGSKVSAEKIQNTGFQFEHKFLKMALGKLYA
ncbi:MAG: TIGR01777 family oxidoreductase [Chitinophagales bacterium]